MSDTPEEDNKYGRLAQLADTMERLNGPSEFVSAVAEFVRDTDATHKPDDGDCEACGWPEPVSWPCLPWMDAQALVTGWLLDRVTAGASVPRKLPPSIAEVIHEQFIAWEQAGRPEVEKTKALAREVLGLPPIISGGLFDVDSP